MRKAAMDSESARAPCPARRGPTGASSGRRVWVSLARRPTWRNEPRRLTVERRRRFQSTPALTPALLHPMKGEGKQADSFQLHVRRCQMPRADAPNVPARFMADLIALTYAQQWRDPMRTIVIRLACFLAFAVRAGPTESWRPIAPRDEIRPEFRQAGTGGQA